MVDADELNLKWMQIHESGIVDEEDRLEEMQNEMYAEISRAVRGESEKVSFRKIPIVPTIDELLHNTKMPLRENKVRGKFKNNNDYVKTFFYLLREDFVRGLKKGIRKFK